MTDQERWPRTHDWGEWTPMLSERMHERIDSRIKDFENKRRLVNRIGRVDSAASYTAMLALYQAIRDEMFERDRAAREQCAAAHRQWEERNQYARSRNSLWADVLRWARTGELPADWRRHLTGYVARCAKIGDQQLVPESDGLALHELTTLPPQPWEPYVTGGDWRTALAAWYRDMLALHDRQHQHRSEERASEPPRWFVHDPEQAASLACREADSEAVMALSYSRKRDRLEAWYRAGLAAGGDDEDWSRWWRDRIATWDRRQDDLYGSGLSLTADYQLTHFGELVGAGAAGGWHTVSMHALPDYWTTAAPPTA